MHAVHTTCMHSSTKTDAAPWSRRTDNRLLANGAIFAAYRR